VRVGADTAADEWIAARTGAGRMGPVLLRLKRLLDVAIAAGVLATLSPALAVLGVWIRVDSRGPILYSQLRVGLHGGTFRIWKLRTMVSDAEQQLENVRELNVHADLGDPRIYKFRDDPRVTSAGRFLRRHSLDELPQLWNVLRGEMSLVGPRPLTIEEDVHVAGADRRRLRVLPGLTGPWQVGGRNRLSFTDMMRLDGEYVDNWSLLLDLRLLARTIPVVLQSQDSW
jgi:lipopolysaccharide/colanic/teichoic acid biosynthesis glycosyltransferase